MHTTEIAVRFHELDCYGHVNHATYLSYFETARVEALAGVGLPLDALRDRGLLLVVVEARIRYLRPATLGERLAIDTALTDLRSASARWHQAVRRADVDVATLDVRTALTGTDGRPRRLPAELRGALTSLRPADDGAEEGAADARPRRTSVR